MKRTDKRKNKLENKTTESIVCETERENIGDRIKRA